MDDIVTPQELANELIGTAAFAYPEERLATREDVETFESLAFECDDCGWWCSTEELNNETSQNLCDECNEGDYDD